MQEISSIDLFKLKAKNKIIDVRDVYEFEKAHIEGSINIPLSLVFDKFNLFLNKKNVYYLICKNGVNSKAVATFLEQKGYQIIYVTGGIDDWPGILSHDKYY